MRNNHFVGEESTMIKQTIFKVANDTKDIFEFKPSKIVFSLHHIIIFIIKSVGIKKNHEKYIKEYAKPIFEVFFFM